MPYGIPSGTLSVHTSSNPGALYDSYGRIEPDDARLLVQLLIDTKNGQLVLVLEDGSKLPILLMSSSGAIRVQGVLEAAHT